MTKDKHHYKVEHVGWYGTCKEPIGGTKNRLCGKVISGHTRHEAERKTRQHIRENHR